jgi:hypothetical protein
MKKKLRKNIKKQFENRTKKRSLWNWIKENPILKLTIVSVIISAVILFFMLNTYESAPEVNCVLELIQRPDSLYQAQLYIWNEGDKIAENIIIWAKKEQVFLYDTSGNYQKGRLNMFPHLTVYAKIPPAQYLDDAGRMQTFLNHQIMLPQLPSSLKEDNYIIIGPNVGRNKAELEKLMSLPNSIYKFKYVELGKTENISSYQEEILDNVKVLYEGINVKIQIGETTPLRDVDKDKYYFPTFGEFDKYQSEGNIPNNIIPPFGQNKKIIKNKKDDSWFLFF